MNELKQKALEQQRAYAKEWRAKNRDKVRKTNERYWLKKARLALEQEKRDKEGDKSETHEND